jgi:dTDP-4-amino-4,6-dideoxygalactose transaminase
VIAQSGPVLEKLQALARAFAGKRERWFVNELLVCASGRLGDTMTSILVPQANPRAGYCAHRRAIDDAIARVLASGSYILGEEASRFEHEYAAWAGTRRAVTCASGTDAIALILRGLNVGAGSTVVTVSHTAVATVAAVEQTGAIPLFLDIEPAMYTMDADELSSVLAQPPHHLPEIRAVLAVHLYGQAADLTRILAACNAHGVPLIEDCAQAHGASLDGRKLGTFGRAAAFSFYPTKNLGALGDAGAVTTNDNQLADRIAMLRQYGWRERYISSEVGVNSRIDELQAGVLRVKLPHLNDANRRRQAIADIYDAALENGPIPPPTRRQGAQHAFHQYVVRVPDRDRVQTWLRDLGIGSSIHYPVPVHQQPAFRERAHLGPLQCRETERACPSILSLPIYPELTDHQTALVSKALRQITG